jgi:hypothetical protein
MEEWHTFLVELNKEFGTGLFTVKDIVERLAHDPYTGNSAHLDYAALTGDLPQKWGFVKDGNDGGFRSPSGGGYATTKDGTPVAGHSCPQAKTVTSACSTT